MICPNCGRKSIQSAVCGYCNFDLQGYTLGYTTPNYPEPIKAKAVHRWRRKSRYQIRMLLYKEMFKYPFGITVSALSRELKLSRRVIREELVKLTMDKKLVIHQVGKYNLYVSKRYSRKWRINC